MAEDSYPWAGTTVGDAGPYKSDEWQRVWRDIVHFDPDNVSIVPHRLGLLEITSPAPNTVRVSTGAAFVNGSYYVNDEDIDFVVPSDAKYIIFLKKDWVNQTIRAVIEVDTTRSMVRNEGLLWEGLLATVRFDNAGFMFQNTPAARLSHFNTFVDEPMLEVDSVNTSSIIDNSVTEEKLADGAVSGDKLGAGALRLVNRLSSSFAGEFNWETLGSFAWPVDHRVTCYVGTTRVVVPAFAYVATVIVPLPVNYENEEFITFCTLAGVTTINPFSQETPAVASCQAVGSSGIALTLNRENMFDVPPFNRLADPYERDVKWITMGRTLGD